MPEADISPEHFVWLIDGRSSNQKTTLDLYQIIYGGERQLNNNVEFQEAAQELTGVAISLWRAVFLSDTSDEYVDQLADLKKFLVSLISDNTVLYITDKNARNWSFRYYLDNAWHRLRRLADGDLSLVDPADLSKANDADKDDWMQAQAILANAVQRFGASVRSAS